MLDPAHEPPLTTTSILLDRFQAGDDAAGETLLARYLRPLERWAHGRLSADMRGLVDTADLAQIALVRAMQHMRGFRSRSQGSFFAYLRQVLMNALRDEVRRAVRRPRGPGIDDTLPDPAPSQLEELLGREKLAVYEEALANLSAKDQELVFLRIEFGLSHREIAEAIGLPSENAARMAVTRAIERLGGEIHERWHA
jgi:RNA polymerase sigma factor (sigma-70 family)